METIPRGVTAVARAHAAQLAKLNRSSSRALSSALHKLSEEIRLEMESLPPGALESQGDVIAQLLARAAQGATEKQLADHLGDYLNRAGGLAPGHMEEEINAWLDHHGVASRPLNLAAIAAAEIGRGAAPWRSAKPTWLAQSAQLGKTMGEAVRDAVVSGITRREPLPRVTERVQAAIGGEEWKAQRLARTEMARAYNAGHLDALESARVVLPGLKKSAIATFDSRSALDSVPVHGQVRELEDYFIDGDGRRYPHPPGRPNDREKEIPWLDAEDATRITPAEDVQAALEQRREDAAAPALETPEGRAARLSRGWQQGSHGAVGVELREAARQEFGLPGALYTRRGQTLDAAAIERTRGDVRSIYNSTQADLAERGIATVRLYRGMSRAQDIQGGVESWTTDESEAERRGGGYGVIVKDVPASRILWSSESPGWSAARRAARSEYLVLSDTPVGKWSSEDFEIGFFTAKEAGGEPLRESRGIWGLAGEGDDRTLYHIPTGRTVFKQDDDKALIELARRIEARGYVDGAGRLPDSADDDALRTRALQILDGDARARYRERSPEALKWARADFDLGGLSARDLDPGAERAGAWGILDYPPTESEPGGGVALVERASGRPLVYGAYRREDLRRVAAELDGLIDSRGRLPGEDTPAFAELVEELESARSFYKRQRVTGAPLAGEAPTWIDMGGGLDFASINPDIQGGKGETWSKRIIKVLEESNPGDLNISEQKAYVNGNFAIFKTNSSFTSENGFESVDWHLVHLKTGVKMHSGTGMKVSEDVSDAVPFRIGGWRLNEFQKVAKSLETYLNADGSVKPEKEEEWLRDIELLNRATAPGEDVARALGNRYDREDWQTSPITRRTYSRLVEEGDANEVNGAMMFLLDAPEAEELRNAETVEDVPF